MIGSEATVFGPLFSTDSGRLISRRCEGGGMPPFVTHRWDGGGGILRRRLAMLSSLRG
jgi:hypothetical protein